MADGTHISWSEATWNPITGCTVLTPGCTRCYAMKLAGTRLKHHWSRIGLTRDTKAGPVWTGEVRFNEQWLDQPLRWKRPRMIFVCAHSDLFHEKVPDEWIDRVFAVMALAPQHTFQILTKRAKRMREYLTSRNGMGNADICRAINMIPAGMGNRHGALEMPLPNCWIGVSVEDQPRAAERIPDLLATPAALHWVSAEPLLGPVDLEQWLHDSDCAYDTPGWRLCTCSEPPEARVGFVVAGGESQGSDRPTLASWFRSLRDQCIAAGTPFHLKQWGDWVDADHWLGPFDRTPHTFAEGEEAAAGRPFRHESDGTTMIMVGAKNAGRTLDGREWDEFPR